MSSLYEINNALLYALARAELQAIENDGIIEDATAEMLDALEMDREVKITLIATGFASKTGLAGESRDEELTQFLKGLKSEEELDVPSFLRRPLFSHRRQAITPSTKPVKQPMRTPVQQGSWEFTT